MGLTYIKTHQKRSEANEFTKILLINEFDRYMNDSLINDYQLLLKKGCVYYPNFFCGMDDYTYFNKLKQEMNNSGIINWSKHKKWENPQFSSTYNEIIKKISIDFNIEVIETRLNYYSNGNDWKPAHKDRHATYEGLKENYTLGLSLGGSRELEFTHESSNHKFRFPQNNGDIFGFTKEVNEKFLHGVPKCTSSDDRISIIIWGIKNE